MRTKRAKALTGFAAALLIIAAFTWLVGWGQILDAVSRANTAILFLGGLSAFLGLVTLGVAWWIVVRDVAGYHVLDGLRVFFATMFANSVTPLGQLGGEPFIAYIVSKDSGVPIEEAFGAVLAADLLNTVQFFTVSFLGILIFLVFFPLGPFVSLILKIIVFLVVLVAAGVLFVRHRKTKMLAIAAGTAARVQTVLQRLGVDGSHVVDPGEVEEKGEHFYSILEDVFQQREKVARALLVSHGAAAFWVSGLYLIVLSLGVDAPVSAILFILPASMLAGYLPLPGGLGGIEVAMTALLTAVAGVPLAVASAGVLIYRLSTYWMGILIGGYFSSRLSVDLLSDPETSV